MVFEKLVKGFLIILLFFSSQYTVAQEEENEEEFHHCLLGESSFILGLGAPYSFELNKVGINTRIYYGMGENICFGPEFSYFKNEEIEIWDIDFVIHYIIETPWLGIYPVAGINYTNESVVGEVSEKEYGFLWGVGMHRNFKKVIAFAEYTRVESPLHDQFVTLGLMYHFKLK